MKEVNLEEILKNNGIDCLDGYVGETQYIVLVLEAMKEACEQAIDLCAKNANLDLSDGDIAESFLVTDDTGFSFRITVNKQSILNTKTQIK